MKTGSGDYQSPAWNFFPVLSSPAFSVAGEFFSRRSVRLESNLPRVASHEQLSIETRRGCRFRSAAYRSLISGHGDVVVARAHARNILEWTRVHNAEAGESTTFISTMISSTNSNGRETRVGSCAASSSCPLTATRRAATLDEKKLSVE